MEIVFVYYLARLNSASYPNELKLILSILFPQKDFVCIMTSKIMVFANINADILEAAC